MADNVSKSSQSNLILILENNVNHLLHIFCYFTSKCEW